MVIIILECFFCKTLFPSSSFNITKDKQLKFPPSFSKNFILHLVFLFTLWLPNILNCPPSMYKFYIKVSSLLPLCLPQPLGKCVIFSTSNFPQEMRVLRARLNHCITSFSLHSLDIAWWKDMEVYNGKYPKIPVHIHINYAVLEGTAPNRTLSNSCRVL